MNTPDEACHALSITLQTLALGLDCTHTPRCHSHTLPYTGFRVLAGTGRTHRQDPYEVQESSQNTPREGVCVTACQCGAPFRQPQLLLPKRGAWPGKAAREGDRPSRSSSSTREASLASESLVDAVLTSVVLCAARVRLRTAGIALFCAIPLTTPIQNWIQKLT